MVAETIALATILHLARETGVRLHLTRISSADGLDMVPAARATGIAVTCDVAVHHLHLCDQDIGFFDPHARLDPPLRTRRDRDALRAGLADGSIDALCSDHTPVDDDAKQTPFDEAEPGATGLELLLPLTLKWATERSSPWPGRWRASLATRPASLGGINGGTLSVGAEADVCVFDPRASFGVTREALRSQGKNTPFLGTDLPGRVRCTLISGHLAYSADRLL